tara:strand:- start:404 stop:1057 length:654 start_codon:yes stop_codon:yes gene_type:complete
LKFKNKSIQVACDGGAATGKSTAAKLISRKYNLKFLSSGLLYRYVSYLILKNKPKNKISFIEKKFKKLQIKNLNRINLHSAEISEHSSIIAKNIKIRKILKKFQINFSKNNNCCIEGRDIATKILPNSDLKFFFRCSLDIASKRRFNELKKYNRSLKLNDVKKALKKRNFSDTKRKNSPLLKHRDSIVIDTGKINKLAMVKKMSFYVEKVIKQKYDQ